MQTKDEVENNFKQELKTLLKKYNAEFDVLAEYGEFGAMITGIEVFIPELYINNALAREQTIIELTKWFDCDII